MAHMVHSKVNRSAVCCSCQHHLCHHSRNVKPFLTLYITARLFFKSLLLECCCLLLRSLLSKYCVTLFCFLKCSHALLDNWMIASPANLIEVIVLSIALFGTVFGAPSIFLYIPASKRSMSCLFHKPAAASGVPMYMSIALAKQHVRRSSTSQSTLLSLHLSSCTFLVIYSFEILIWSFLLIVTFTPKYLTVVVQLMPFMPLSSSYYSPVSISDFLLLSLRFHLTCSAVNSSII